MEKSDISKINEEIVKESTISEWKTPIKQSRGPKSIGGKTRPTSNVSVRGTQLIIGVGIVILVTGIGLIIISPSLLWQEVSFGSSFRNPGTMRTTDLRYIALFSGLLLLIVGGVISAIGLGKMKANSTDEQQTASLDELEKLASLRQKDIITQEEYEKKKKQILGI